jgi:hypothetical protein
MGSENAYGWTQNADNGFSFDHTPYSPDLTLSKYHLFTFLKNNYEELMEGVKTWLSSQAADFSDSHTKAYSSMQQVP